MIALQSLANTWPVLVAGGLAVGVLVVIDWSSR